MFGLEKLQEMRSLLKEKQEIATVNTSLDLLNEKLDLLLEESKDDVMEVSTNILNKAIHLTILIDISGSMLGTEEDIYVGLRNLVKKHQSDNILFTLIMFESDRHIICENMPISNVEIPYFYAKGGTNLNGTIYYALKNIDKSVANLGVVISDGENTDYDSDYPVYKDNVRSLMNNLKCNSDWYFIGEPNAKQEREDVYSSAIDLGFLEKNISVFTREGKGNRLNFEVISKMLDELLNKGSISENWSNPIQEHYLRLEKKGR